MASRRVDRYQTGPGSWRGPPTGHRQHRRHRGAPYRPSDVDMLLGLASPGAFPCPEGSPSYNIQFSQKAGDGHLVAFGTEFGQLVILDTRAEARVQRDRNGPVGWGQTDRNRTISSGAASTRRRLQRELGGAAGSIGYCRKWGVRQPEVVAQFRALVNCIFDLEWTHEDSRIALGCGDGKVRVYDTETHAEVVVLCGHGGSVKTLAACPLDNDILLSGSRDGSFALWDTRSQPGHDMSGLHRMMAIESAPLATAPVNRVPLRYLSPVEQVYRANCDFNQYRKRPRSFVGRDGEHPDASAIAAATATATTPPKPRQATGTFYGLPCVSSVTSVCWMKDGQKFLTAGQDGLVKLWDTRYAVRPLQAANPTSNANAAASPSPKPSTPLPPSFSSPSLYGRAVPRSGGERSGKGGGAVGGGRVTGGETVAEESYPGAARPYGVSSVHACDDGSRIAVSTVKSHISVFSYASGSLQRRGDFTGTNNTSSYYIKAKLSPDGSLLASGACNDAVCLWQVDCPGPPVARLMGHVNEVTGLDFCRAEPLKLATCSDDETVRVWTVDPLRVLRNSSSSSRAAPTAAGAAAAGGEHPTLARGTGARNTAGVVRGGGGRGGGGGGSASGSGSAAIRGVSGWTPIPVLPGVVSGGDRGGGGGGSRDGDGEDDGDGGSATFVSRGKFGLGRACIAESFCRKYREPRTGTVAGGHSAVGGSGTGGRQVPEQAGRGKRQSERERESESGGGESENATAMEVCSSSPQAQPRPQPKVALPLPSRGAGASDGCDGGAAVFCPRSPNKKQKPGTARVRARTSPSPSAGLVEAAVDVSGAISAAAQGAAPARRDENTAPDPSSTPHGAGDDGGTLAGVVDAREQGGSSMDLELDLEQGLDVGTGTGTGTDTLVVDRPAAVSPTGKPNRGPLDGLPSGWSEAKGGHAGGTGRGLWQRKEKAKGQGGAEGWKTPRKHEEERQKKNKGGGKRSGRGATSRGGPVTRDNRTLMDFWKKGQGGPSSENQGQGKAIAPAGTGLGRHGRSS